MFYFHHSLIDSIFAQTVLYSKSSALRHHGLAIQQQDYKNMERSSHSRRPSSRHIITVLPSFLLALNSPSDCHDAPHYHYRCSLCLQRCSNPELRLFYTEHMHHTPRAQLRQSCQDIILCLDHPHHIHQKGHRDPNVYHNPSPSHNYQHRHIHCRSPAKPFASEIRDH